MTDTPDPFDGFVPDEQTTFMIHVDVAVTVTDAPGLLAKHSFFWDGGLGPDDEIAVYTPDNLREAIARELVSRMSYFDQFTAALKRGEQIDQWPFFTVSANVSPPAA